MKVLALSLLISTIVWSVHLVLSYYLAWADCVSGDSRLLLLRHLVTIVAQAATIAVLIYGVRLGRQPTVTVPVPRQAPEHGTERRFLAKLTVLLGAVFLVAIAMAGAANLYLLPCV